MKNEREFFVRLLLITARHEKWQNDVEEDGRINIDDDPAGNYSLLYLIHDELGVPPEEECSHEFLEALFELMVVKHKDAGGYLDILLGKRALPQVHGVEEHTALFQRIESEFYPKRKKR